MINKLEKIKRKIRKRIQTIQLMEGRRIKEVQITKEESEQLGDGTKEIDAVELIIVDKLGEKTRKDCFAYIERGKKERRCYCLENLECINNKCKFYRNDIKIQEIEKSIRKYKYAMGK